MAEDITKPKKRGRKAKINQDEDESKIKVPKKRGRKPKGG